MKAIPFPVVFLISMVFLLSGCTEEVHNPVNRDQKTPAPVTNPTVENLPGAARISYQVPHDKGLLYVKAVFEPQPGISREVKASYYAKSLVVDGFGDTNVYEVKLFSVGRNGKSSVPLTVSVNPLTPPVQEVFESIALKEDWGGISFTFTNENEANVVFEVVTKDSLGEWTLVENFYTSMKTGKFAVRGFGPEEREFGISVRDRWYNRTDTLSEVVNPWFEVLLDKTKFRKVTLPTDYNIGYKGGELPFMWDGNHGLPDYNSTPGFGLPQWFTIDLGTTAILSRIKIHLRTYSNTYLYNSGAVKLSELYGSLDPNPDGSWDSSWTYLRECRSVKPSGLPQGQNTAEDLEYAKAGEEFTFENAPVTRFIRWKVLENWGGVTHANIDEIYIYGQPL